MLHLGERGLDLADEAGAGGGRVAYGASKVASDRDNGAQPRRLERGGVVWLDGYFTNRAELARELVADPALPDVGLWALAYARWGAAAVERLEGSYVVGALVHDRAELLLARDPLGTRPACFRHCADRLYAASDESVLLAAGWATRSPDRQMLAELYALRLDSAERSFYAEIESLPPGGIVLWDGQRLERRRRPFPVRPLELPRHEPGAWIEAYAYELRRAVRQTLPRQGSVGVLLSSGLDSSSVLAMLLDARADRKVHAWTYGFDTLPESDEREALRPWVERLALDWQALAADAAYPLAPARDRLLDPSSPISNPYRELKDAVYAAAAERGVRVLLTGQFGDHLYPPEHLTVLDAACSGAPARLLAELGYRAARSIRLWRDPALRTAVRVGLRRAPRAPAPEGLVAGAKARLAAAEVFPPEARARGERLGHWRTLLGLVAALDASRDGRYADRHGVETRHPLRSWGLVNLMLHCPAHWAHRAGVRKWLARQALIGILPEPLRTAAKHASLEPLFARGRADPLTRARVSALLAAPGALWPEFLVPAAVDRLLTASHLDQRGDVRWWVLVAVELWRRQQELGHDHLTRLADLVGTDLS